MKKHPIIISAAEALEISCMLHQYAKMILDTTPRDKWHEHWLLEEVKDIKNVRQKLIEKVTT
jgi:hypothetical protein